VTYHLAYDSLNPKPWVFKPCFGHIMPSHRLAVHLARLSSPQQNTSFRRPSLSPSSAKRKHLIL